MTETIHNDLERRLRELFDGQHRAITPSPTEWNEAATIAVVDLDAHRVGPRRRLGVAAMTFGATAATIAIGLAVVVMIGGGHAAVKTQPRAGGSGPSSSALPAGACTDGTTPATFGCSGSVQWDTPQVHLYGAAFSILTTGATGTQNFTAIDSNVEVQSDPGDATYQTLELTWHENGVEQRWYIYFASDGKDWWVTEMRTYDGAARGEWVYFMGERFRTALGSAWSGDIDLTAGDHGVTSHLRMVNARLQPFLSHGSPIPNNGA
jgi:hypothetical protein